MQQAIWRVFSADGDYIGMFNTRFGNFIMRFDERTANHLKQGQILHIDEVHTNRAWIVKVGGRYKKRIQELYIAHTGNRKHQYLNPVPKGFKAVWLNFMKVLNPSRA